MNARGHWQAVTANILWGTTFLGTHEVLRVWGPATTSAVRFLLASIFLGVGMKVTCYPLEIPRNREAWLWVVLTSVLGFGLLYPLQALGLAEISTSLSSMLMLTAPLFLIGLSAVFGDVVTPRKWLAVSIGMIGGVVLVLARRHVFGAPYLSGICATLGSSLCLAASSLTSKRALSAINKGSLTFWSMALGAIFLLPFAAAEPSHSITADAAIWGWMIYLSLVCSVIAFFLWNHALAIGQPATIASTMHPELKDAASRKFINDYQKKTGRMPNDTSVLAYDATKIFVEALIRSKSKDRVGIENALNKMTSFDGITGHFRFTPDRAPSKSMVLLKNGPIRFEIVDRLLDKKEKQ